MNLLDLQRQMAEDVRRPLTPEQWMQQHSDDGRSVEDIAASYIKPNANLTSFERLEIYNRQYWFRVIGAVTEDFPALQAVLGATRFDALILAYLVEHPSLSWTLRDLGAKLPEFVAMHPELCGRRRGLATDVAQLEWAYVDAFDGKVLAPLMPEDLQALEPASKLSLQPHLRLLALNYPVDDLVLAIRKQRGESEVLSAAVGERKRKATAALPQMKRRKIFLAVHRFDDSVYYRRIEREEFLLLTALRERTPILEAITRVYAGSTLSPEQQAAGVQQCFAHGAELGWFCPHEESAVGELPKNSL